MSSNLLPVAFEALPSADLHVGRVYLEGAKNWSGEVLQPLMGAGTSKGFRSRNVKGAKAKAYCVLWSTGRVAEWPDKWSDADTYVYYGDQRKPGKDLHDTSPRGNQLLADIHVCLKHGEAGRRQVPPLFLFESTGEGRNARFGGLMVPAGGGDWLRVKTLETDGGTITNYESVLKRLPVDEVPRLWLTDLHQGYPDSSSTPAGWKRWVETGETAWS